MRIAAVAAYIMNKLTKKLLARFPSLFNNEELRILDAVIHEKYFKPAPRYLEQSHFAYWERQPLSWEQAACPVRPSRGDGQIYRDFLGRCKRKNRILVLGSTPEIRDLVAEGGSAKVYVADFSYSMPAAMLKFTSNVDPMREVWIRDNWLELALPPNFFDVILGDVVLHQVTPAHERAFLSKISSLLRDDGSFITRLFFLDEKFLRSKLRDITAEVLAGPFTQREKLTLLKLQTVWLFADLKNRKFDRRRSAREFGDLIREGGMQDPILQSVNAALIADRDSYREWSPPGEEELVRIVSSAFVTTDRRGAHDYRYAEYFPIFSLTPKRGIS
ncbi:MAG: hypothetical protein UY96_C0033G0010 [Parcubacteria group bacterium GW2011_GWB1_56_8]|nr:MAG: hypothetical protein UY96_C0033G0010 [Parcubacteria group bacterium GW2011_GWB1_56_8]